jgi:CTP:molybdopterin cytidylyltransferase MocA
MIAGVVLAAGASRRLGRPKQIAVLGGETLLHRAVRTVAESECDAVAIVVGAHATETSAALADLEATVLSNERWTEGIASSIRTAVGWADANGLGGLLLAVCDQPLLTTLHLDALLTAFRTERRPIGSSYAGVVGVPAVFGRAQFSELMQLRGDCGASAVLRINAGFVAWPPGAIDVDTQETLDHLNQGGSTP